jgi:hypothetical protein
VSGPVWVVKKGAHYLDGAALYADRSAARRYNSRAAAVAARDQLAKDSASWGAPPRIVRLRPRRAAEVRDHVFSHGSRCEDCGAPHTGPRGPCPGAQPLTRAELVAALRVAGRVTGGPAAALAMVLAKELEAGDDR